MTKKTPPIKDKEPTIKDLEELIWEGSPSLSKGKIESLQVKEYVPHLPYPSRLKKEQVDEQFKCFQDLLKQYVLFVKALAQVPKHAKFLKDLLTIKQKF